MTQTTRRISKHIRYKCEVKRCLGRSNVLYEIKFWKYATNHIFNNFIFQKIFHNLNCLKFFAHSSPFVLLILLSSFKQLFSLYFTFTEIERGIIHIYYTHCMYNIHCICGISVLHCIHHTLDSWLTKSVTKQCKYREKLLHSLSHSIRVCLRIYKM